MNVLSEAGYPKLHGLKLDFPIFSPIYMYNIYVYCEQAQCPHPQPSAVIDRAEEFRQETCLSRSHEHASTLVRQPDREVKSGYKTVGVSDTPYFKNCLTNPWLLHFGMSTCTRPKVLVAPGFTICKTSTSNPLHTQTSKINRTIQNPYGRE